MKRRGVLAETWSPWYGAQRDISVEGVRTRLLKRIRRDTIAGIFLSPPSHTFSRARRGKVGSGWPIAVRHDLCPEGFSWLEGFVREAASRANNFANACADVVIEGIKQGLFHATASYMWSLDTYCRLRVLYPTVSHLDWCQFGSRFRRRTTTWSWNLESQQCCRPAIHVAESAVCLSSRINTADNDLNRPERQVIPLSRGACVTLLPPVS